MLLGSRPKSHPLPELAALAPTSPSFAGRGGTSWPKSLAADKKQMGTHHFWQIRLNGDTGRSFTTTGLMVATSPNAVGGGRMEPLATFGRGAAHATWFEAEVAPPPGACCARSDLPQLRWERWHKLADFFGSG